MLLAVVIGLLLAGAPEASAAPANATEAAPVQKPEEKKICRKDIETGSLIKGRKICYTARQWQKIADTNRSELESRSSSGSQSGQ